MILQRDPECCTCMSSEEKDTCMSSEEEDTCMSSEEEDTCMSYGEEDTCMYLPTDIHSLFDFSHLFVTRCLMTLDICLSLVV